MANKSLSPSKLEGVFQKQMQEVRGRPVFSVDADFFVAPDVSDSTLIESAHMYLHYCKTVVETVIDATLETGGQLAADPARQQALLYMAVHCMEAADGLISKIHGKRNEGEGA